MVTKNILLILLFILIFGCDGPYFKIPKEADSTPPLITITSPAQNEIVSGLIFDPIKDEIFFAEKNNGAFFNNHRIRVSNKSDINDCLFATNDKTKKDVYDFPNRKTGCAALDLAYVASGRFDGFFQKNLNNLSQ